ncbi:MAG TPA: dihydrolipoamide acetyltransferase family protein [Fimbriimonadales bacterium]|nr:dihydrolipoamide acetyltransferase family protein [Fimbriimonadales bacterium]
MIEVIMPKMGDAMEEGTLVEWKKKEGDKVESGEVIGMIQTDKAVVELNSPGSGKLAGILISEGETVPVGEPIAAILSEGESLPEDWGGKAKGKAEAFEKRNGETAAQETKEVEKIKAKEKVPVAERVPEKAEKPQQIEQVTKLPTKEKEPGRVLASPLARKLAAEAGIPLESIEGTGPGGRIVEQDVQEAIKKLKAAPAVAAAIPTVSELKEEKRKLTFLQKITAERTTLSKQQIPHYYVTVEVDLENLERLRDMLKEQEPDMRITINDFVIKACAMSLMKMPHINATYDGDYMHIHGEINIGVATAVPDGLTLPVLKNVERKSLREIALEVRDLVNRARENRLKPDELVGSTFAISNMGMFNVENFAAIINPPNGAIVAIATARRIPVVRETEEGEELEIRTRMKITGSFDHRIIDGAVGAEFMGVLREYLESPIRLIL